MRDEAVPFKSMDESSWPIWSTISASVCSRKQSETRPVFWRLSHQRRIGDLGQQGLQDLRLQIHPSRNLKGSLNGQHKVDWSRSIRDKWSVFFRQNLKEAAAALKQKLVKMLFFLPFYFLNLTFVFVLAFNVFLRRQAKMNEELNWCVLKAVVAAYKCLSFCCPSSQSLLLSFCNQSYIREKILKSMLFYIFFADPTVKWGSAYLWRYLSNICMQGPEPEL